MFLAKRYRNNLEILKENNNCLETKLFDRKSSPRVLSIVLVSVFLAFYCVSESVYLNFSATYFQYIPLKLTASKSAEIVSAMATSYTIGRGISVLIAIKIKPQLMIGYHFVILITSIIILLFGQNSITLIWIGGLTLSFGFSSVFPAIISFISQYLMITDRIGTILVFSSTSITMFAPLVLGTYIEKFSPIYVISIVTNISISILLFIIILYIIRKTKKNYLNFMNNSNNNGFQLGNTTKF
jgi:hypothetical protein